MFIDTNDSGDVNDSTLWETLKAAIRGDIISYETVMKNPIDLLKTNWKKWIDKLKQNIDFWKSLPVSSVGRMNAVKLVPFYIPQSHFKQLYSIIPFIWSYKTVRVVEKQLTVAVLS